MPPPGCVGDPNRIADYGFRRKANGVTTQKGGRTPATDQRQAGRQAETQTRLEKVQAGAINTRMITSFKEYAARRELAEAARGGYAQRGAFNEMAARRSLNRSMDK